MNRWVFVASAVLLSWLLMQVVHELGHVLGAWLTGGIATGVVTYSVNEPIIYLGNVYGEIGNQSFAAGSAEAAVFALARSFHNWSFIPYAMYSVVGLMIGYMHYNRKQAFSISSSCQAHP